MKKYLSFIAIGALIMTFGLAPTNAAAGTFTNTSGFVTFGDAIFGTGSDATLLPSVGTNMTAAYAMASAPGPGAAFIIEYTLSGNTTWGTALTAGSLVYAGAATLTIALTAGGGAGDQTASFRVDVTAVGISPTETFTLTYNIDTASALATPGTLVTLGVTLTDTLIAPVDTAGLINVCTSADGTTETGATSTAGEVFIDVARGNAEFLDNAPGTNPAGPGGNPYQVLYNQVTGQPNNYLNCVLGRVTLADTGLAVEDDTVTAWAINSLLTGDTNATVTLTVTGDFSAAVTLAGAGYNGVFFDANNNGIFDGGDTAAQAMTSTTATITLPAAQIAFAATNIVLEVDGVTEITEQDPTCVLAVNWTIATYLDEQSATVALRQLRRNGVTRHVLNIPNSGSQDANFIRVTNPSTLAGFVYGTLYDAAGTPLGTANTVMATATNTQPQPAQSTYVYTVADIETIFGLTAPGWTGRARLVLNAELPAMEVLNMIRTGGVLTNVSTGAPTATHTVEP